MNRKEFLSDCGRMGFAGVALSLFPWLESCSEKAKQEVQGEKARIGIIGTGSLFVKVDKDWRSSQTRLRHYGYDLN